MYCINAIFQIEALQQTTIFLDTSSGIVSHTQHFVITADLKMMAWLLGHLPVSSRTFSPFARVTHTTKFSVAENAKVAFANVSFCCSDAVKLYCCHQHLAVTAVDIN